VASQVYQFAFTFSPVSMTTSFQTSGATAWASYQQPNFTRGQFRAGGPNNPNNPNGPSGNYLVVAPGDSVFINLVGPTNWKVPNGMQLQVIVSQADSPAQGQGYSPFANGQVQYSLSGTMMNDGVTMQYQIPGTVQSSANPGQGNWARYELTVAFSAADASGNVYYFADDPEMDVQGSGS
jgi:hypothetical protein